MTTRILLVSAGLLTAFAAGRISGRQPDTIVDERAQETRQATETVQASSSVEAEATTAQAETARVETATQRVRIVYRDREVRADGSSHERELEVDAETARVVAELEASKAEVARLRAQASQEEHREVLEVRAEERRLETHDPLPNWIAGPMVGVDVGGLRPVYGAMGANRIAGPFHLGAWLTTTGTDLQGGALLVAAF